MAMHALTMHALARHAMGMHAMGMHALAMHASAGWLDLLATHGRTACISQASTLQPLCTCNDTYREGSLAPSLHLCRPPAAQHKQRHGRNAGMLICTECLPCGARR
eukprot:6200539-Pleurochrysis_carterae.AAC.1